jgi:predicted methyltransferase
VAEIFFYRAKWLWGILSVFIAAGCSTSPARQNYSAVLADSDRPESERALDAVRKPAEVLAFYEVKSGDKVADLMAGRGYYTALLSRVVGPRGTVYSAIPAPRPEIAERWKNSKFANVRLIEGPMDKVALPQDGSFDFVFTHLNYHDLAPAARTAMNKRVFGALKSGGVYGVIDHSAREGSGDEASKTLHRIDKLLVIKEVTGAGFKLMKEGSMLSRPEDKRDFNVLKKRNINDRFVLAFQKP